MYRGLKRSYRPEKVGEDQPAYFGTDFTDCPLTALRYASSARGVVIVLDLPDDFDRGVSEELWFNDRARRLMVWGRFDRWIVAVLPAKELRQVIRRRGIASASDEEKVYVLRDAIQHQVRNPKTASPHET